ncbi:MAG: hypothetical protein AAGC86_00100 [Pseudomonadota bacterium]
MKHFALSNGALVATLASGASAFHLEFLSSDFPDHPVQVEVTDGTTGGW